jgi:hypothetical protein
MDALNPLADYVRYGGHQAKNIPESLTVETINRLSVGVLLYHYKMKRIYFK